MSTYNDYLREKENIEKWVGLGYSISKVTEHLDGAHVEFKKIGSDEKVVLHIRHADARKYFSSVLIKQQKEKGV